MPVSPLRRKQGHEPSSPDQRSGEILWLSQGIRSETETETRGFKGCRQKASEEYLEATLGGLVDLWLVVVFPYNLDHLVLG